MSESKFTENPSAFIPYILKPNRQALLALITKPDVERKLLLRLQKKAETYAQDIAVDGDGLHSTAKANGAGKIDVDGVLDLYESYIIPLTKEVEVRKLGTLSFLLLNICQVEYLLHRLDGLSQEEIDTLSQKNHRNSV